MLFIKLYLSFLQIGLWGFGGGYGMLALIQNEVVTRHGWLTTTEFTDIVAISQMTPGPISINCATYVGYTVTGSVWGSAVATMGVITPSIVLMSLVSFFYVKLKKNRYISTVIRALRPITVGLILSAALILLNRENFIDYKSFLLFAGALVAGYKKVNTVYIILGAAILGYVLYI